MARPKAPLLSRELIARAAIELVDSGQDLQVVPIAERLGVSVSSLYHHVRGRTGIIHAMREVLGQEFCLVPGQFEGWEPTVRASTETLWRLYAAHPKVLPLLVGVVVEEPDTVGFYSVLADALDAAGVPEAEQLSTIEVIDAFAFGAALDTLSPDSIFDPGDDHPRLSGLTQAHPKGAARNQLLFQRGIDLIVLGIKERARLAALE